MALSCPDATREQIRSVLRDVGGDAEAAIELLIEGYVGDPGDSQADAHNDVSEGGAGDDGDGGGGGGGGGVPAEDAAAGGDAHTPNGGDTAAGGSEKSGAKDGATATRGAATTVSEPPRVHVLSLDTPSQRGPPGPSPFPSTNRRARRPCHPTSFNITHINHRHQPPLGRGGVPSVGPGLDTTERESEGEGARRGQEGQEEGLALAPAGRERQAAARGRLPVRLRDQVQEVLPEEGPREGQGGRRGVHRARAAGYVGRRRGAWGVTTDGPIKPGPVETKGPVSHPARRHLRGPTPRDRVCVCPWRLSRRVRGCPKPPPPPRPRPRPGATTTTPTTTATKTPTTPVGCQARGDRHMTR